MMADFRPMIAEQLKRGPRWIRSFQKVKAHMERMVADGEARRVRPDGGTACNMVELTDAGRKRWLMANMKRVAITVPAQANDGNQHD